MDEPIRFNRETQEEAAEYHSVLSELSGVLKKRGYMLIHRSDTMVLVKITSDTLRTGEARVYVKQISPQFYEHAPMNWGGPVRPDAFTTRAS